MAGDFSRSKEMFKKLYDSDKDLTLAEQKKIKKSRRPSKTRDDIWEEKGTWKKTKKMMKGAFYGDKRAKKKVYGK